MIREIIEFIIPNEAGFEAFASFAFDEDGSLLITCGSRGEMGSDTECFALEPGGAARLATWLRERSGGGRGE